jgi:type II secretory pathway pseudopilin PulG
MVLGFARDVQDRMAAKSRAFTLIETLVCVAIVMVLSGIALVSYQGALDNADLKYAAPAVAGRLEALRREASDTGSVITVDFHLGTPELTVTRQKAGEVATETVNLDSERLIKRRLRFLRFEWPDGTADPARFTFLAGSTPQGGTVYFGTGQAETRIRVQGGNVVSDLGVRDNFHRNFAHR